MDKKDKRIIFFYPHELPRHGSASAVQFVNVANAAACLGYDATLICFQRGKLDKKWAQAILPFRSPDKRNDVRDHYMVSDDLQIVSLPSGRRKINSSGFLSKNYYLPFQIFPRTRLFYVRDINYARISVEKGVPCICDWDFPVENKDSLKFTVLPSFKLAVANTNYIKKNLIENGVPAEKVIQAHNGFNQKIFRKDLYKDKKVRQKLLEPGFRALALYVGAILQLKGIDIIIDSAKLIPDVNFVLVGGGKESAAYEEKVISSGLNNIKFLGQVEHSEVGSILRAADVLLYPHLLRADAEFTSPIKLFEYLASGVPIASTIIPALEGFRHKGLVIEWCQPDSEKDFAGCVRRALEKYPKREDGYITNIEFANNFTWEKRVEKILDFVGL